MTDVSNDPPPPVYRPRPTWYAFIRSLAACVYWVLGGIESEGTENLPPKGPVIVAPTHFSFLDPPAIACATKRHMRFMAKEELFVHWFGKFIFTIGAFKVRRGDNDTSAIRYAISLINDGQAVLVFPEGSRGDGETIGPVNKGVALLAKQTGAPIVPVAIVGTHIMLPRGQKYPKRHRIKVIFGTPYRFQDINPNGKVTGAQFAQDLENRLLALSSQIGLPLKTSNSISIPPELLNPASPPAG